MKLYTLAAAGLLFASLGAAAQVEVSAEKKAPQKKMETTENEVETIVVKKAVDADMTTKDQTGKDKEAAAAIAEMKAAREAKKQKAREALLEKARKEGLMNVSDEERAKRQKQIEAQKKKYEARKAKQEQKLEKKTKKYNKKIDNR